MKKKIILASLSIIGVIVAPITSLVACGNKSEVSQIFYKGIRGNLKTQKVVAQSFEPIDFLATFGKKPDFYTKRSDQGIYMDALPDYLNQTTLKTEINSQIIDQKIYDWSSKQSFNPTIMLQNIGGVKGVLLTYQSLHVADEQIKQAFDGVVYDDLGNNSGLATYGPGPKLGKDYKQPRMYDVTKNYKLFAEGLDHLYGGSKYKTQANINIDKFNTLVQKFATENSALSGKDILVVRPNERVTDQNTADNIAIWTPLAYNLLYADKEHNGLGMSFPQPKDTSWPKSTTEGGYFDPWAINTRNSNKARVSTKVVDEYSKTADIVIYLQNMKAWGNVDPDQEKFIKNKQSSVSKLLKDGKSADNIYFADYSLFYRGMYGLIGQQEILKKIAQDPAFRIAAGGITITMPEGGVKIPSKLVSLSSN